jgi:chromosome segregation ATPase
MQKISVEKFRETLDKTRELISEISAIGQQNNKAMAKDAAALYKKLQEIEKNGSQVSQATFIQRIWYAIGFGYKSSISDSLDDLEKNHALAENLVDKLNSLIQDVENTFERYDELKENMTILNRNLGVIIEHNQKLESKVEGLEAEMKNLRIENKSLHAKIDDQAKKIDTLISFVMGEQQQQKSGWIGMMGGRGG